MKLIHTADWQIGMKAAHVGAAAPRVRRERLAAAARVVELVSEHTADFLLLAGDTFEDNACDRVLVQQTADILSRSPAPVYILPGNHDPLCPGSVWEHPAWDACGRVTILRENGTVDVPGGVLYACPLFEKHASFDPTAWVDAAGESRVAIGVAHGNVEGAARDGAEYPIPRDAASRRGLDYLALGHWHSTAAFDEGRVAYSGAHETTKFGEHDSGNALLIEIEERGAPPRMTRLRSGGMRWLQWQEEIDGDGALEALKHKVETVESGDRTLLDLTLRGLFRAADVPLLGRIEELVAARFLYARLDTEGLAPESTDDSWQASLPPGALRVAAERLRTWSVAGAADGVDSRVAAEALRILHRTVVDANSRRSAS